MTANRVMNWYLYIVPTDLSSRGKQETKQINEIKLNFVESKILVCATISVRHARRIDCTYHQYITICLSSEQ